MTSEHFTKTSKWGINVQFNKTDRLYDVVLGQIEYIGDEGEEVIDVYFSHIIYSYSEDESYENYFNKKFNNDPNNLDEDSYWSINSKYLYSTSNGAFKVFLAHLFEMRETI